MEAHGRRKKKKFGNKRVLSAILYEDEFETNNPLGSHRGVGKVSAVYIVLPCLPVAVQSKTENIFTLTLYNSWNEKYVPVEQLFA